MPVECRRDLHRVESCKRLSAASAWPDLSNGANRVVASPYSHIATNALIAQRLGECGGQASGMEIGMGIQGDPHGTDVST